RDYASSSNVSGQVKFEIDKEVRKIVDQCYKNATNLINEHKDELVKIAEALIEHETLTAEDIDELIHPKTVETVETTEETNEDKQ
ncbi:MAG: cell division protein FtsH, partial [Erysipelotrichaceae bacterium]|nr:cell division protein FtsH [Erysipelotrichaceae bacterium]